MIITANFMNHYFPPELIGYKPEYFRLFGFEMQNNQSSPVKGWKWKYLGKEIPDERMKIINEYFQTYIVPRLKHDNNMQSLF